MEIVSVTVPIFGQQAQTITKVQPKVPKFTKKLFPSLLIILSPITFSKIHRDFKPDIFPTSIFFRIVHHSAREKTSKGQFLEFKEPEDYKDDIDRANLIWKICSALCYDAYLQQDMLSQTSFTSLLEICTKKIDEIIIRMGEE